MRGTPRLFCDLDGNSITLKSMAEYLALPLGSFMRYMKQSGFYPGKSDGIKQRRAAWLASVAVPLEEQKAKESKRAAAWRDKNRVRFNARQVAYVKRRNVREPGWHSLDSRLRRRSMTLDQFHALYESQDFCCAICCEYLNLSLPNTVHVDHCHRTGGNRGILCAGCNIGLGAFKDNPAALRAAADYVTA